MTRDQEDDREGEERSLLDDYRELKGDRTLGELYDEVFWRSHGERRIGRIGAVIMAILILGLLTVGILASLGYL